LERFSANFQTSNRSIKAGLPSHKLQYSVNNDLKSENLQKRYNGPKFKILTFLPSKNWIPDPFKLRVHQYYFLFIKYYDLFYTTIFTFKFTFLSSMLPFFLKTPDIIFSVMQKPFKKCVFHMRVSRFFHIRKKIIRRFQKKRQYGHSKN
jgi:hypothetical protein